jgi:hypothetical protein
MMFPFGKPVAGFARTLGGNRDGHRDAEDWS